MRKSRGVLYFRALLHFMTKFFKVFWAGSCGAPPPPPLCIMIKEQKRFLILLLLVFFFSFLSVLVIICWILKFVNILIPNNTAITSKSFTKKNIFWSFFLEIYWLLFDQRFSKVVKDGHFSKLQKAKSTVKPKQVVNISLGALAVVTTFLQMSRISWLSRLTLKPYLRQIETPRLM